MPTFKIPHNLAVGLGGLSHVALAGGAIALYVLGKIPATTFAVVMASLGGVWVGVAGALKTAGTGQPVTQPVGSKDAPGVTATPVETPPTPATGSD